MRFFNTLKEAGGYKSWKSTRFPYNLKGRLSICLDDWHSALRNSWAWVGIKTHPEDGDCENALDEMHEHFGADAYVGDVLCYKFDEQGKGQCVRKTFPILEKLEKLNLLKDRHFVPKDALPSDWDYMDEGHREYFLRAGAGNASRLCPLECHQKKSFAVPCLQFPGSHNQIRKGVRTNLPTRESNTFTFTKITPKRQSLKLDLIESYNLHGGFQHRHGIRRGILNTGQSANIAYTIPHSRPPTRIARWDIQTCLCSSKTSNSTPHSPISQISASPSEFTFDMYATHGDSIWYKDYWRPTMTLFSEVPPSWTHLVRKVELVFVFSEGDCENARWYLLPWLVGWTKNGTLKEMTLTGYGATNFRQMLDIRKDKERNIHVDRWNRPGLFMPLFQLMQEAGVSEFDKLIGDHNLKRRLNVYIDDLHKVKARGNGWKHAIKSDDYHDALDEMHEYFGADLYAGGLMQEAGVSEFDKLIGDHNLKRRLNVYIDDLHKVKARGNGWKHAIKSDDYHDALDEMHEYFGADLYAGGVLAYQNGKRVQSSSLQVMWFAFQRLSGRLVDGSFVGWEILIQHSPTSYGLLLGIRNLVCCLTSASSPRGWYHIADLQNFLS
ncbi:uncharacterized protein PAC_13673 [Phialocephala subalpina]|uniref:Uncharacterized protein n=1 Tax=Phialocephala subalpina TaxID=576137 RepID=A0A1L7XFM7_9HELO|nr:uncharacterized protein PAC_13673 [Phialocephala subalpina]